MRLSTGSRLAMFCGAALWGVSVGCNALIGTRDVFFADDASVDAADGGCVDTQADSHNCGRCGHDCLGGACEEGRCQAVTLKSNVSPFFIKVDQTHIYWIDALAKRVVTMNKDGSGEIELASYGLHRAPWGLDVDDTNVYFGDLSGPLLRCALGGCNEAPDMLTNSTDDISDLVVDDRDVYWVEKGSDASAPRLMAIDKKAHELAAGRQLFALPIGPELSRVVADANYLFTTSADGIVRRISKATGVAEVVTRGTKSTWGIFVHDDDLYFTETDDPGNVRRVSKTATDVQAATLAGSQHHPIAVAADQTRMYWLNLNIGSSGRDGTLMSCPLAACGEQITTLAANLYAPINLAIDDEAIYWVNSDTDLLKGSIMKIAKP